MVVVCVVQGGIFAAVPLQSSAWLQGRLSQAEWVGLLDSLNRASLSSLVGLDRIPVGDEVQQRSVRLREAMRGVVHQTQAAWAPRGITLSLTSEWKAATHNPSMREMEVTLRCMPNGAAETRATVAAPPPTYASAPSEVAARSQVAAALMENPSAEGQPAVVAAFCRYCGAPRPSDGSFCERCGKQL